ncbi:outer membrane protein assembly factor BamE [Epibacterium ulvae]|uniref:outer membrane protein assembly factor BamE n=1 Tax=Epibacterium ulvae TaxID=1156985 RepID=UPI00248F9B9A|nr:outer membrane protein assembly factor BamE [Epibacterium ulvae]
MTRKSEIHNKALKATVFGIALTALTACASIDRKHGYVPSEELLADIVPGVDTKEAVDETIGQPSTSGVLRDGGYYYVTSVIRNRGVREPKVISRELVAINFNETGTVTGIQRFGLEDGKVFPLQRRITESNLRDKTFLRQLLGNLGNFNPGDFLSPDS